MVVLLVFRDGSERVVNEEGWVLVVGAVGHQIWWYN